MELVMEQIRQQLAYRACPKCRETEDNGMIQEPLPVAAVVHGGTIMALLSHYCGGDYFSYQVKMPRAIICACPYKRTKWS